MSLLTELGVVREMRFPLNVSRLMALMCSSH
jgi:hypothetical protein